MSGAVQAMMGGALQATGGGGQTWDPAHIGASLALSVGNTVATRAVGGAAWDSVLGATVFPTGTTTTVNVRCVFPTNAAVGIGTTGAATNSFIGSNTFGIGCFQTGDIRSNVTIIGASGFTFTTGDIINIIYDAVAQTVKFSKNGGTPSGAFSTSGIGTTLVPAGSALDTGTVLTIS